MSGSTLIQAGGSSRTRQTCLKKSVEQLVAYLDTCIVSGLAREDLPPSETAALLRILRSRKRGELAVVTSAVARNEIERVPDHHRTRHEVIYTLLADVPAAATHRTDSGLALLGVGGGRREDPLFSALKGILPDAADAEHVFQAAKNNVPFFITADVRTILRHAIAVEQSCGVKVLLPTQFEQVLAPDGTTGQSRT